MRPCFCGLPSSSVIGLSLCTPLPGSLSRSVSCLLFLKHTNIHQGRGWLLLVCITIQSGEGSCRSLSFQVAELVLRYCFLHILCLWTRPHHRWEYPLPLTPEPVDSQLWCGKVDGMRLRHASLLKFLFSLFQDGCGTENHVPEGGGAEQAIRTLGHAEERDCVSPRKRKYPLSPLTFLLFAPGAERA